tara:strand:+ start:201 stop:1601 length:1401 start_codon:yes stop_codon:yes gene_type:complete
LKLYLPPYAEIAGVPSGPHQKQAEFHALTQRHRMYRGGLGAGKSLAGSRELMATILENYQHSAHLGGTTRGGLLYLVGAPTYDMCTVGAWHHITQWLTSFEVTNGWKLDRRRWTSHPRAIELVTGDVIKFLSVSKPQTWAAATAAAAWLDESELCPDPLGAFQMLQGRLRDNRAAKHSLIVTSSPRGNRGVAKLFADKEVEGDPDYGLIVSSSFENPGNAAHYVEAMASTMSDYERRQQIEAELLADENSVFAHEFDEVASMAHHWTYKRGQGQWRLAIDWGGSYHCLIIHHDPSTEMDVVVDEVIADGIQDIDFINLITERCKNHWGVQPADIAKVVCDYNPRDACRAAYGRWRGRVFHRRVRDNQDRWSRINTLRWRLCEAGTGTRRLLFAPHLRKTQSNRGILRCFANYALQERWIQGERVVTDRPIQESPFSHGVDALGYYVWNLYSHKRLSHDKAAVGIAA